MNYEIELSRTAERVLNDLPPWIQGIVEARLADLANSPTSLSRPAVSPPYPPGEMISEFSHGPVDGVTYHIAICFRYSQDETRLFITSIGRVAF
jgi:hypothetical protein